MHLGTGQRMTEPAAAAQAIAAVALAIVILEGGVETFLFCVVTGTLIGVAMWACEP